VYGKSLRLIRVLSLVVMISAVPAAQGCGSGSNSTGPSTDASTGSGGSPVRTSSSGQPCCRVCSKGKACGNTCINVSFTCHVGAGCACNR